MPRTLGYHRIHIHLSYRYQHANVDNNKKEHTFRDDKEADGCNCILVSTLDSIVRVANGQIEWVVLYVPSCHSDCSLIAPKDNQAVYRTFSSWVRCKDIILYVAL
jgi:hypothetical protein